MMIMHKLQQLDTTILNDFKRDYLESRPLHNSLGYLFA